MLRLKRKALSVSDVRQRQRSLGGNSIYAYHSNRLRSESNVGRHKTAEKQPAKRPQWWRHLPTIVATVGILASIGYSLTLSTNPRILTASGDLKQQFLRPASEYQTFVQHELQASPLELSKFSLDRHKLEEQLTMQFPELLAAQVSVPLIDRRPVVALAAAPPALLLNSQNTTYILDARGRAIIKAADAPRVAANDLPLVNDESGLSINAGKAALPPENVTFIRTVNAQLKAAKLSVQSLTLPPIPEELHVHLQDTPYYIKFDLMSDARQQVGAYLAVKDKLGKDRVVPADYVDVRVEERVYYR